MKDYLTRNEMMEYFNINADTLREWEHDGLKVVEVSKRKRFYKAETVKKWIDRFETSLYEGR